MHLNRKGAALMQVLLIAVILAGIATMLLRANLSRTISARKTRVNVSAQTLIESCMAEVNMLWATKTSQAFQQDYSDGNMYCEERSSSGSCKQNKGSATLNCSYTVGDFQFTVQAAMNKNTKEITYTIIQGQDYL